MGDAPAVSFIGAGPGDPELLTVRGQRLIREADVVIYTDSLVHPGVAALARPEAEVHGSAGLTLEALVGLMAAAAAQGKRVARVHTGDPTIFGAVQEQVAALEALGVSCEVVPGVSSVFAAAAALGVELTVPELSQTVILTRMEGRTPMPPGEKLRDLARHQATLVLFLSVTLLDEVVAELLAGGYPPETPAAVVHRATWEDEKVVRGTLADIAVGVREAHIHSHALILVGKVFGHDVRNEREAYRSRLYDPSFSHSYRKVGKEGQARRGRTSPSIPPRHGEGSSDASASEGDAGVLVPLPSQGRGQGIGPSALAGKGPGDR